jgi:hypothetical protein
MIGGTTEGELLVTTNDQGPGGYMEVFVNLKKKIPPKVRISWLWSPGWVLTASVNPKTAISRVKWYSMIRIKTPLAWSVGVIGISGSPM